MDVVTRQGVAKELLADLRITGGDSFLWESTITTVRRSRLILLCTDLDSIPRDPDSGKVIPAKGRKKRNDESHSIIGTLHLFDTEAQFGLRIGEVRLTGPQYYNPYYVLSLKTPLCEVFRLPNPVSGLRVSRLPLNQWLDAAFPGILFAVREELKLEAMAWQTNLANRRELEYLGFKLGDYTYTVNGDGTEGRYAAVGCTTVNERYLRQRYLDAIDESLEALGFYLNIEYPGRWEHQASRKTIERRAKVKEDDAALMLRKDKE